MTFNNREYLTDGDWDQFMIDLKQLDPLNITDSMTSELVEIMNHTIYTNIRGKVAIKLGDTYRREVLPAIIRLIRHNIHTKYIGSMIYACEELDCHEYLELFVDIIMVKDDMTVLDAYSVIQSIKSPVDPEVKLYCINKLRAFQDLLEEDSPKYTQADQTIEAIEKLSVFTTS